MVGFEAHAAGRESAPTKRRRVSSKDRPSTRRTRLAVERRQQSHGGRWPADVTHTWGGSPAARRLLSSSWRYRPPTYKDGPGARAKRSVDLVIVDFPDSSRVYSGGTVLLTLIVFALAAVLPALPTLLGRARRRSGPTNSQRGVGVVAPAGDAPDEKATREVRGMLGPQKLADLGEAESLEWSMLRCVRRLLIELKHEQREQRDRERHTGSQLPLPGFEHTHGGGVAPLAAGPYQGVEYAIDIWETARKAMGPLVPSGRLAAAADSAGGMEADQGIAALERSTLGSTHLYHPSRAAAH